MIDAYAYLNAYAYLMPIAYACAYAYLIPQYGPTGWLGCNQLGWLQPN